MEHGHGHIPVLSTEILDFVDPQPSEIILDCTVGTGGHSILLGERIRPGGRIVGCDLDADNLAIAEERLRAADIDFTPVHTNFSGAANHLKEWGLQADIVLADLGFSSRQMDDPARGFSFREDGPLDMRYDRSNGITAADLLETVTEQELKQIIREHGEDPLAAKIARKLIQNRRTEPIRTTARLASLVVEAYGLRARSSRMHPATRTFMALRIAVNDELGSLRSLLDHVVKGAEETGRSGWLNRGARVAMVSFHSLEDRLVKRAFSDLAVRGLATRLTPKGKPVTPTECELRSNPRSRPAKLRVVRMTDSQP